VRVQPRASTDALAGVRAGALLVRLAAPPVEGKANAALIRLLAHVIGIPPSAVQLVRGAGGRDKLVRVSGLRAEQVRTILDAQITEAAG
jgi:uncharacterized protein (TIGR00251 family)